jgi:four helix bundle protein
MRDNVVLEKSKLFAIRVVNLYKYLCEEKKEYVLSKQLLRSGTSIGANLSEAVCGISRNDFLAKVYIAFKESHETIFWLELLKDTKYISEKEFDSIYQDSIGLVKLLSKITKTTKSGKVNN